ncbi:MAG: hypothetical protein ACKVZH_19335 [Blastocatellia bacterium]
MKRISLFLLPMAFVSLVFASMTTFAQTEKPEKISLRITPKPDQSVRLRMVTEMDIEMNFEGAAASEQAALPPMKMQMKSATTFTQKTGPLDKQNRFEMELVYDDVSAEMMMNGNAFPVGDEMAKLKGMKIKVTMDQSGNIFDVQAPKEAQMDAATFKELLKSLYGALPTELMAVGETATVPLTMALSLPLPGSNGPLNLQGSSKIKLLAIEKEGTNRLAKLETVSEARMTSVLDFPSPNGPAKMKMDFSMTGGGPSSINLDNATVKTNDLIMTLQGKMSPAPESADAKLPTMALKGTVKTIVTSVN